MYSQGIMMFTSVAVERTCREPRCIADPVCKEHRGPCLNLDVLAQTSLEPRCFGSKPLSNTWPRRTTDLTTHSSQPHHVGKGLSVWIPRRAARSRALDGVRSLMPPNAQLEPSRLVEFGVVSFLLEPLRLSVDLAHYRIAPQCVGRRSQVSERTRTENACLGLGRASATQLRPQPCPSQ